MNEIPAVWLWLSGAFFAINIVFFGALTFVTIKLAGVMKEIKPKINSITEQVEKISAKVDSIAGKVDDIAGSVKVKVEEVGGKTSHLIGTADTIANFAAGKFERSGPLLTVLTTLFKVAQFAIPYFADRKKKSSRR